MVRDNVGSDAANKRLIASRQPNRVAELTEEEFRALRAEFEGDEDGLAEVDRLWSERVEG
jgi:hypothetical protein